MKYTALAVVLGLATLGAVNAGAASRVTVTGSGLWGANAPTTPYSVSGQTFAFSFTVANPYPFTSVFGVTSIAATDLTAFSYTLGGTVLATSLSPTMAPSCSATLALCDIELFPSNQGGGLNLDFGDFSVDLFEANGKSLGDQGVLTFGNYSYTPNINGTPSLIDGAINEGAGPSMGTVVPEPASWAMLGFGVFGAGAVSRRARRQRLIAAAV